MENQIKRVTNLLVAMALLSTVCLAQKEGRKENGYPFKPDLKYKILRSGFSIWELNKADYKVTFGGDTLVRVLVEDREHATMEQMYYKEEYVPKDRQTVVIEWGELKGILRRIDELERRLDKKK